MWRVYLKPSFLHNAVNGPFEDPAVHVRILREKADILFDAGDLRMLPVRHIMRLTDIFITHTHIDHFIGFDTILRALLRRNSPVSFYGPLGITDCISGKLKGYTWNLIKEYPLELFVHEVEEGQVIRSSFSAQNGFEKVPEGKRKNDGVLWETEMLTVKTSLLDHGMQTLGFRLEEKFHININKDRLIKRGLDTGPWLNTLKRSVRDQDHESLIDTGAGEVPVRELADIYTITEGQKISFVMDSSPSEENIKRIIELARGCDTLYIEAYFAERDRALAEKRHHLTSAIAGSIAHQAGVRNFKIIHVSPRYMDEPEMIFRESEEYFRH